MTFRVHVRVMPRAGLLDPQGQMCDRLLANPVTEDYELEVEAR